MASPTFFSTQSADDNVGCLQRLTEREGINRGCRYLLSKYALNPTEFVDMIIEYLHFRPKPDCSARGVLGHCPSTNDHNLCWRNSCDTAKNNSFAIVRRT